MKKLFSIGIIITLLTCFISTVDAAEIYKRGIATKKSVVLTDASSGSANLLSDIHEPINLSPPEAFEIVGEKNDYYQVKFLMDGFLYVGYIPKANVAATEYIIDEAYRQDLINRGFPADYAKKLAILHVIHPNWTFTPSYTGGQTGGMDFNTAVAGEARYINTNAIQSKNTTLFSTRDGAYENGVWKDVAGKNWKAASEQTIAFYMDPRNFLDESHIFMFENAAYNPNAKNREAVEKILQGTFMAGTFNCFDGANNCVVGPHSYTDTFLETGAARQVSPAHLATRVKIEQGAYGAPLSLGVGWKNLLGADGKPLYVGLYNFFNIGASGATDTEIIENGFKRAQRENWNNQYISIYAGSSLISNNYIGRGQSTRYYQKFNTITPTYFINQYMQNVQAPYKEAYMTYSSNYSSYNTISEWDQAAYDFLIPIYQNMGAMTSLDVSYNNDATLSNLSISACKLSPEFMSNAYTYDCYAVKETTELDVTATATNANAKVEYPAKVALTSDEQTFEIKVTAVNGTPAVYTINVKRVEMDKDTPEEMLNKVGYKVDGIFMSNVEYGSDVSNIIKSITNSYHFTSVKITEADGTEITSGLVKTGQKVTISNVANNKTFDVVIYGDANGNGSIDILDLLSIQKHLLKSLLLNETQQRGADANKDNKVDILDLLAIKKHLLNDVAITQE